VEGYFNAFCLTYPAFTTGETVLAVLADLYGLHTLQVATVSCDTHLLSRQRYCSAIRQEAKDNGASSVTPTLSTTPTSDSATRTDPKLIQQEQVGTKMRLRYVPHSHETAVRVSLSLALSHNASIPTTSTMLFVSLESATLSNTGQPSTREISQHPSNCASIWTSSCGRLHCSTARRSPRQ
jgi:hypothetical protein